MDASGYYADLTDNYLVYGGEAQAWHYGLWEPGVRTEQEALLGSNRWLLEDIRPDASTRILDVGFGSGGFSTWAARRFGCPVTGITVCAEHVPLAEGLARERGVAELCSYRVMDMDALDFADESFDVVVNQDTFCHAGDKLAYLRSVERVLRPGGWWRCVAFSVRDEPLGEPEQARYRDVCEGFHIPSMWSGHEVREALEATGFSEVEIRDATAEARPSAERIYRRCTLPLLATALGVDWIVYSTDPRRRRHRRGHIRAARAYSHGLLHGYFRHNTYSARRPQPTPGRDRGGAQASSSAASSRSRVAKPSANPS